MLTGVTRRVPPYVLALGAFLLGLFGAGVAGLRQSRANARALAERWDAVVQEKAVRIQTRVGIYQYGLRGARGALIAAGPDRMRRADFRAYAESRDLDREFGGARGMGIVFRVPVVREADFVASAKADGYPGFTLNQIVPHDGERYVITYIEPVERNAEAVGLDIGSESNRREAALRAMRTGEPTLTAPITLVQATRDSFGACLLLMPIYRVGARPKTEAERVEALIGWSYAPLVLSEVLADLERDPDVALSLRDEEADTILFSTKAKADAGFVSRQRFTVYGRTWVAQFRATPHFVETHALRDPRIVVGVGATVAAMAAALVLLLAQIIRRREEVRAERSRLAAIVDSSSDAIIGQALDGTITDWNGGAERLFGYTAKEACGRRVADLILPEDCGAEDAALRSVVRNGDPVPAFDTVRRRKDGTSVDVSVAASPIFDASGRCVGSSKTLRDITEARRAERDVRELNASLEALVAARTADLTATSSLLETVLASASGVSIIAADPDLTIRVFNRGAERLLGYESAEVVGRMKADVLHDVSEVRELARVLSNDSGKPVRGIEVFLHPAEVGRPREWTYVRKDGSRVTVSLIVTVMRSASGQLLGYLGIAHDVTLQKKHEATLREATETAERASQAKSQFLANMSHEIRTPMNAVIGLSYLLGQTGLDAEQAQLLSKIHVASKSLLGVINDVLDLSKIEANELTLERAPFRIGAVIDELRDIVSIDADAKGIDFDVDVDRRLPEMVFGDAVRLNQILTNLLANAVKFTDRGGVSLSVRCEAPVDAGTAMVRFEVRDTGVGISEAAQMRLFAPFVQADASTTRRFGGTGLGLSIVKRLVSLMGGTVSLASTEGMGSEFTVRIPFSVAAMKAPVSEPRPGGRKCALLGYQVLVVDDSEVNLIVAKRILELQGATVTLARTGQEAYQILEARPDDYDVVLMDVQMPVLDGCEATRRVRRELGLTSLPIIALTADARTSERERTHDAGMDDFISKPFEVEAVVRCIKRQLSSERRAQRRASVPVKAISAGEWPDIDELDSAALRVRLQGDFELLRTLLHAFCDEFGPGYHLPRCDDPKTLGIDAIWLHKLKGVAGQLHASTLEKLARRAELACVEGDATRAAQLAKLIGVHIERLRHGVEIFLTAQAA